MPDLSGAVWRCGCHDAAAIMAGANRCHTGMHGEAVSVCGVQYAAAAAAAGKSWAGNAVAALISGGLGCLRLADAESAAQAALPRTPLRTSKQPDSQKPYQTRRGGANILQGASRSLTSQVLQSLGKRGLAGTLLQVRALFCFCWLWLVSCGLPALAGNVRLLPSLKASVAKLYHTQQHASVSC